MAARSTGAGQTHECTAIFVAQRMHQGGGADRTGPGAGHGKKIREANGVNAYQRFAVATAVVDAGNRIDHLLDRWAGGVVEKYINADVLCRLDRKSVV